MYELNSFLTLTFSDEHLPENYSVSVQDMQLFMKRLRKYAGRVRFFACGEYGGLGQRPHYHVLLFGYDFGDKTVWSKTKNGDLLYRSAALEKLWPYGNSWIGSVTFESAGYVARYVTKKIGGDPAEEHYTRVHPLTGEQVKVHPEFVTMSLKPGIGQAWFDKYSSDAFPSDFVVINGRKLPVPRFYARKLSDEAALLIKAKRKEKAHPHKHNQTDARLLVREEVQELRATRLKRDLEDNQ